MTWICLHPLVSIISLSSAPWFGCGSPALLSCDRFLCQILGLLVVRKMMDLIFSQHDLAWLDDILPDKDKKKKEDEKKKKEKKKARKSEEHNSDEEVRLDY